MIGGIFVASGAGVAVGGRDGTMALGVPIGRNIGPRKGEKGNFSSYSDFPGRTDSFSACNPFTSNIGSKLLSGLLYDPPALSAHVKYWP